MTQEDPNAQSLVGQSLGGKYQVVRLLGEGGMGAVYLGEQKLGQSVRKVAIKTLHAHLSHDPKVSARFERELSTVIELTHPNTIQVFDSGKTDSGILYIVMEYAEGHSVAEDLEKNGPMTPERVEKILVQVCGSLEEAHNHGIVHRDLKPDNILLCERGGKHDWVEVLDFGIAKRGTEHDPNEQKLTQQGTVLGTPPYMSPEQFTGKPVDARSDIYSLGVMAYEMLSGKMPFNGNTAWEWASAHMTAPPAPIEQTPLGARVPAQMRATIAKALEKQPENRFQNVKEFIDAFTGSAPIAAAAAAAPEQPRAKTEIGAPIPMIAGAGFGAAAPSPQTTPGAGGYGPTPAYGPPGGGFGATPSSGNQAFSAAQGYAREDDGGGGGKRGILIALIAVLGIGALGLVLFGLGVFKSKPADDGTIGGGGPTTTLPTSTPVPGDTGGTSTTTATTGSTAPLPTLNEHGATTPASTGKKTTPTSPTSTTHPTTTASTPTSTPTTPPTQPTSQPTHTVTPPPPNPPACSDVPKFCNHPAVNTNPAIHKACEDAKQKCIAAGGHV